jgi:LysR family transcriptional regulator, regulator for metE and metH
MIIGTMDLEVRHLKLVREVSAAGSLTRAGASLHLTQSALSHQLRDIESRLGTALFLRVGKRMVLTPAGERLLRSADEVLAAIERTEEAIRNLSGDKRGVLRLTTECLTCYHWLPSLMKRYRQSHPQVDIRIDVTATSDPVTSLVEGRLDVAIVSDPVRDRRVVARPLFDDELVVVLNPQHPLASRSFLQPEDFAQETLLTYSPKEESTIYQRLLLPAGVMPVVQQVQITEAMIELVKAGLGVAVLARWAVDPYVKSGQLRAVRLTRLGYRRTWSAATLKDMARVPYVKAFIDLIAAHPPFTARARGIVTAGGTSVGMTRGLSNRRIARRA